LEVSYSGSSVERWKSGKAKGATSGVEKHAAGSVVIPPCAIPRGNAVLIVDGGTAR
jgi:hypothetical protein